MKAMKNSQERDGITKVGDLENVGEIKEEREVTTTRKRGPDGKKKTESRLVRKRFKGVGGEF